MFTQIIAEIFFDIYSMQLKQVNRHFLVILMAMMTASCASQNVEISGLKPLTASGQEMQSQEVIADPKAIDKINKKLYQAGSMENMTLSYVAQKILSTNPDIEIYSAREEQAKIGVDISRAKYWPTIDVKVNGGPENVYKITGDTLGTFRTEASLGLNATIWDFGKRDKDLAQSETAHEAAVLRSKNKVDLILLELTNAYLDVLETRALVHITNRNIQQIHKFKNLVNTNLEEGNASVADFKKVEARLENANSGFVDLKTNYETARENFKKITDFYPRNLKSPPRLSAYEQANFASDKYNMMDNKYELNAVRKDIESLTNKLDSLQASRFPTLKFGALAEYKRNIAGITDPVTDLRLDFSIKYRVFDGGLKYAETRRVEAQIREGRALLRKKSKNFEQDLRNADSDQKASAKKNALLAKRLAAAQKVVELNTEQFKEGVLTIFELLDAQAQLLSADQDYISNKFQKYRVRYKQLQLADKLLTSLVNEP